MIKRSHPWARTFLGSFLGSCFRVLALFVLPCLMAFFLTTFPSWSADRTSGGGFDRSAPTYLTIGANQVINDDLYLAGTIVTIDGTVKGDAVVAGRQITINGTIEGDLIAAGQAIIVNGTVGDDIRMAGQVLMLGQSARVADDVIAAGLSLESQAGSAIGGNLRFWGAQALLAGTVQQEVTARTISLELRGGVRGNLQATAIGDQDITEIPFLPRSPVAIPIIPRGLTLTDSARIDGNLTYQSIIPATIAPGAQVSGEVVRGTLPEDRQYSRMSRWMAPPRNPAVLAFYYLQRLVALALVGWLLIRFAPDWTQGLVANVRARPLPSLGWGIVTFLAVGIGMIAIAFLTLFLTFVAAFTLPILIPPILGLGLLANFTLLLGFGIFVSFVPQVILSFLGGQWLLQQMRPNQPATRLAALFVGLLAFVLLTAIPVLGGLIELAVILLGLGALWLWGKAKRDRVSPPSLSAVS